MLNKLMVRILGNEGEVIIPGDPAARRSPLIDVAARFEEMAKTNPDELDWKRSIVDLLKLVGMDSSYGARKVLALELGYTQAEVDRKGSAEMNLWLHKEVMKYLATHGAKLPAGLAG